MQQCIKILFPVYMKLNMFQTTWQRPDRVQQLHGRQPSTYAKPEAASAVLSSWWWAVCRPKHVELHLNWKYNFDTLLHLVRFLCKLNQQTKRTSLNTSLEYYCHITLLLKLFEENTPHYRAFLLSCPWARQI